VLPTKRSDTNWEIWNLQSMKKLGAVGSISFSPLVSPDGTYLAMNVYGQGIRPTGIEIFTVADGKSVRKIPGDTERGITGFVGGDLFLSVQGQGRNGSVRLWNVKTGEEVSSFQVVGSVDVWWWAVSPGGRYLALYDTFDAKHVINVYELKTGKLVRTFHPKLPSAQWYNCMGLAFSYDGKEFAALITVQGKADRLQAWDFETGQRTLDHSFATPLEKTAKVPVGMRQTALQWLPDGSGWIAYQALLIDRKRGNVFWTIPQDDPDKAYWVRRFLDANSVATVAGQKPRRQLEIITLPKDQLEAARKK
jgi:WD40 repeat protein